MFKRSPASTLHYEPVWRSEYIGPSHGVHFITRRVLPGLSRQTSRHIRDAFLAGDAETAAIVDVLKVRDPI